MSLLSLCQARTEALTFSGARWGSSSDGKS